MFKAIGIIGWQWTFIPHADSVTTVVFGNGGPVETDWKKLFYIGRFGLYIRGKICQKKFK